MERLKTHRFRESCCLQYAPTIKRTLWDFKGPYKIATTIYNRTHHQSRLTRAQRLRMKRCCKFKTRTGPLVSTDQATCLQWFAWHLWVLWFFNMQQLGSGFKYFLNFMPTWGNDPIWSNWTDIFQMDWNHQLDNIWHLNTFFGCWVTTWLPHIGLFAFQIV